MATILTTIVQKIKEEESYLWENFNADVALSRLLQNTKRRIPTHLSCNPLLSHTDTSLKIIAEIKQASPSQGIICKDFDPVRIATQYNDAGANAISVLTEKNYFKGSINDLQKVRKVVSLPILRKDFIVHPYQIYQAYMYGADIVLLIVAILNDEILRLLYDYAEIYGMQVLVEVHTQEELERALPLQPKILGINNRDLHTFSVNLNTTKELAKHVPKDIAIISESGIFSQKDAIFLRDAGASTLLVGQGILQNNMIKNKIQELQIPISQEHR